MFMLENHLSADQNRVVAEVQAAAGQANVNLFLTGGAMRDMLGGLPHSRSGFRGGRARRSKWPRHSRADRRENRFAPTKTARAPELVFPGGVTAQIAHVAAGKVRGTGRASRR